MLAAFAILAFIMLPSILPVIGPPHGNIADEIEVRVIVMQTPELLTRLKQKRIPGTQHDVPDAPLDATTTSVHGNNGRIVHGPEIGITPVAALAVQAKWTPKRAAASRALQRSG